MRTAHPGQWLAFLTALLGLCAPWPGLPAASGQVPFSPFHRPQLSRIQQERLETALEPLHAKYDPAERMLKEPFGSPGYHTTLKGGSVHSTRSSLNYAVACLDSGQEALRVRAEAILDRVISLQDQDPASKTYGIWSWFLEEPLEKMSPPDWNWADFCGTALLQVALEHRDRIDPRLLSRIDEAIRHAAASIRKRNVGPGYTNIAIMGTYVTLVAAELYGLEDLRGYAVDRWKKFHAHTLQHGGFTEYNSPTYTIVALKELGRLLRHARDVEVRQIAEEIYLLAWKDIARHFHPPTRQWAGPHSRCYRTLLGADVLGLITRATQHRVDFGVDRPSLDEVRLDLPCPRELESHFTNLSSTQEFRQTFVNDARPTVGVTCLTPQFALGSVNRGDFWNQRRPLLAYAGSAEAPEFLRVRFLHDGYDFAAAQFRSAQTNGTVIGVVSFATDGGDTHPSLDRMKEGTIQAKDLRLRFEFGGAARSRQLPTPDALANSAVIAFGSAQAHLSVPYARWGGETARWQQGRDAETAWLDAVLYEGTSRPFKLADLSQAAVALVVSIQTGTHAQPLSPKAEVRDGVLQLTCAGLAVKSAVRPGTFKQLNAVP